MAFLTARVASALLGLSAIPADVADAGAVVALGALDTVAGHVADTTASVASLLSATEVAVAGSGASVRAGARHVAGLAALVACRGGAGRTSVAHGRGVGAVAGDVADLVALVAALRLGLASAVAGDVSLLTAVVAGRGASLGAASRLVAESTTVEASTSAGHFVFRLVSGGRRPPFRVIRRNLLASEVGDGQRHDGRGGSCRRRPCENSSRKRRGAQEGGHCVERGFFGWDRQWRSGGRRIMRREKDR